MSADQPLVAACYARVSTGRQEQEQTIETQIDALRRRIQSDGNILPDENIFIDDGWTGEILIRPSLDNLREGAQRGSFQILYVYDRGRISRIFAHQEVVIEELGDKNISFISLNDVVADTPEGQVMQAMQGVFHQYERVKIAERFRLAKLFKARQGVLINGQSLYGYSRIARTENEAAHCIINEEEARVVQMVRIWFGVEGRSIYWIIKELYRLGIPPRRGKNEWWTKGSITRLLQYESYHKGVVYFNKTQAVVAKKPLNPSKYKRVKRTSRKVRPREEWIPIKVPPIMPDDGLYEKIMERFEENKKYARRNRKYDYLLVGKVRCACGNPRVGDGFGDHHYYRCAERIYRYPVKAKCRIPGVNAGVLDEHLWSELVKRLKSPELLEPISSIWLNEQSEGAHIRDQEKENLREIIERTAEEEKRYAKAYGTGDLDFNQFRDLVQDAKRRRAGLEKQLEELTATEKQSADEPTPEELSEAARRFITSMTGRDRAEVVRNVIDKVIVKPDNQVEACGALPSIDQNIGLRNGSRNAQDAMPSYRFSFTFSVPKPRKGRIIAVRDENGRIIKPQAPPLDEVTSPHVAL